MCGIVGLANNTGSLSPNLEFQVQKMANALRYRGPDDQGTWSNRKLGIALGHRRLSIIDLSKEGHQPMSTDCGRYTLVFNGEIYNYQELANQLEDSGHLFRGQSDTEVLITAIKEWGVMEAVKKLNGMFAFAVWDDKEQCLYLVRDRLGEKPLYYGWAGDNFVFASELKAMHACDGFSAEIDHEALTLFFQYKYIPYPYSIYKGIRKLPPGTLTSIKVSARGEMPVPVPYWSLHDVAEKSIETPEKIDEENAISNFDELLGNTVEKRMVSDVPLGAFLSGGIDSSMIVSLMQSRSNLPVRTFTIGFQEADYDEAEYANEVAKHLGTSHTELYLTSQQAIDVIPILPQVYDEPFADCSQIPTFLVSQLAKQDVSVALSGDGGDELFAGYWRHFMAEKLWSGAQKLPKGARQILAASLTSLSPTSWDKIRAVLDMVLPEHRRNFPVGDRMYKLSAILNSNNEAALYRYLVSEWQQGDSPVQAMQGYKGGGLDFADLEGFKSLSEKMMYMDAMTYLPGDILTKVDRATMAVSLEARVPFLDPGVVEFAWKLPMNMKVRDGKGKWILRQLLARYLPQHLFNRPKMGFGVPIDSWLRGPLREWAEEMLNQSKIEQQGLLDARIIQQKWREHLSGKRNWQYQLWAVLMFQAWHAQWMEN